jgi:hypothetical protein
MKLNSGVNHPLGGPQAVPIAAMPLPAPKHAKARRTEAQRSERSRVPAAAAKPAAPRRVRAPRRLRSLTLLTLATSAVLLGCSTLAPAPWRLEPAYRMEASGDSRDTAPGYLALAQQYEGEGRLAQALDAYRRAAQAAPADADMQNALGLALARHAQFGPAVTALRRAVALAPERPQLLNNLGYALLLDGRAEEARAMFRLTLAVEPEHTVAASNLAHIDQRLAAAAAAKAAAAAPAVITAAAAEPAALTPAMAAAPPAVAVAPAAEAPATAMTAAPEPAADRLATLAAPMAASTEPAAPLTAAVTPVAAAADIPPATLAALTAVVQAVPAAPATATSLDGVSIEILNGNGIGGAAARMRQWLQTRGIRAGRLANLLPYDSRQTMVLYRPGQADAARAVALSMPVGAGVAPAAAGSTRADLRVVIGHDVRHSAGCSALAACAVPERVLSRADLGTQR